MKNITVGVLAFVVLTSMFVPAYNTHSQTDVCKPVDDYLEQELCYIKIAAKQRAQHNLDVCLEEKIDTKKLCLTQYETDITEYIRIKLE